MNFDIDNELAAATLVRFSISDAQGESFYYELRGRGIESFRKCHELAKQIMDSDDFTRVMAAVRQLVRPDFLSVGIRGSWAQTNVYLGRLQPTGQEPEAADEAEHVSDEAREREP